MFATDKAFGRVLVGVMRSVGVRARRAAHARTKVTSGSLTSPNSRGGLATAGRVSHPRRRAAAPSIRRASVRRNSLSVGSPTSAACWVDRQASTAPKATSQPVTRSSPAAASAEEEAERGVEPRRLHPLQPGQQRVGPGRSERRGAPVDEHDRSVGAADQVVHPHVPVDEALGERFEQQVSQGPTPVALAAQRLRDEVGRQGLETVDGSEPI